MVLLTFALAASGAAPTSWLAVKLWSRDPYWSWALVMVQVLAVLVAVQVWPTAAAFAWGVAAGAAVGVAIAANLPGAGR